MRDTNELKAAFLKAREEKLSITHAAKSVGIDRTTPYKWRENDPEFAAAMDAAKEAALDALEDCLYDRAMAGDTIAGIFLLKGHRKHYVDRIQLEHSQVSTVQDQMGEVLSIIDEISNRQLPANGVPQIEAPKE